MYTELIIACVQLSVNLNVVGGGGSIWLGDCGTCTCTPVYVYDRGGRAEGEGGGVYLISCIDTIAIKLSTAEFSSSIPSQVVILDVRVPSIPVARLCNHRASINGITWAPHSSCHICTAGM